MKLIKQQMVRNSITILVLLSFLLPAGCSPKKKTEKHKPVITVSILPQKYFLEQLSDTLFRINVMIPPGASPATYELTPGQMKSLTESNLYFKIGHIGFENAWMDRIALANHTMKIFDTSSGIELIDGKEEANGDHSHAHGVDPHVWMSPHSAKIIYRNMHRALIELFPGKRALFDSKLEQCEKEADQLYLKIEGILHAKQQRDFLIFHPALAYFARDFKLEQHALELEGKEPSPQHMAKIVQTAQTEGIRIVFIQKEFNREQAQTLAKELNGTVVQIDPLAYNWPEQLLDIAEKLDKALK